MGWATLSGRLRAMGLRMLTQRLCKNMVGKCMHLSGGAGEAAAIWECQSYGSGIRGGGGIPEADSDADGVAAVAQGNRMGNSNSQPFRGGRGYICKPIHTKRVCDRVILHAAFSCLCLRLRLGLRPWGLGLGAVAWRASARVWCIGSS